MTNAFLCNICIMLKSIEYIGLCVIIVNKQGSNLMFQSQEFMSYGKLSALLPSNGEEAQR